MLKAFIAFFLFIVTQMVASFTALLWVNWDNLTSGKDIDPSLLLAQPEKSGIALFWASLLLIALLIVAKVARKSALSSLWQKPGNSFPRAFIGFILFAIGESFLFAPLNLDDFGTTDMFQTMIGNFWCVLLLCFVGPITEEMVFREGIVRSLAYKRMQPVTAALVGAVLFGLVHGNPAQAIPAAIMGFILGIFYIRTGNIRLCAWSHIFNNSLAVTLLFFPRIEKTMEELPVSSAVTIGSVLTAVGLSILWQWWKNSASSKIKLEMK